MTRVLRIVLAAAVLALLGLATVVAGAGAVAIDSGKTRLKLDPALVKRLAENSIRIKALKPGTLKGGTLTLPLTEGLLETRLGTKPGFDAKRGIVSAGPTPATLSPYAVAPLNEIFAGGKPVFVSDEPLGTFSFRVRLRSR